jgi:hypothetical protein
VGSALFEMDETYAFYTVRHFDNAGRLISTAFYGLEGCKGVVDKSRPAAVN